MSGAGSSPRTAVAAAASRLAAAGVESPRHDAEQLLAWVLGTTATAALAAREVQPPALERYEAAIRRRVTREPLQHITGTVGFRYLELAVGPGVFVPRPETEEMAGVAVEELRRVLAAGGRTPTAVDLCTGSGAVALALATEVPGAKVVAVEREPAAFASAVRNAGDAVEVRLGDLADAADDLAGGAHVVVANPPYLPTTERESVAPEVLFDPPAALWAGPDGLDVVRTIATVAARLLVDGGLVLCEHADSQGASAPAVFSESGCWRQVRDHLDLLGRPRFVSARRAARRGRRAGTMGL